jgi:(p)ppGpp synthase/HD superfamily hydrolase
VTERVLRAKEIATAAHNGQKDKGGNDYIDHPRRVAEAVAHLGEDYEIVG